MSKQEKKYTQEDLEKIARDTYERAYKKASSEHKWDKTSFLLELIGALNITGGDSISREALEKMLEEDNS